MPDADAKETLIGHVSDTSYMDLPRNVVDSTKRIVLDLLGVTAAGSSAPEAQAVLNLARGWGTWDGAYSPRSGMVSTSPSSPTSSTT